MKIEKEKNRVANLHDETGDVIHTRNIKQTFNNGLVLIKVHRVIKFNENAWVKPYISINTDLQKKAKGDIEKYFFKLMNNAVFGKIKENVRKYRDSELVTTERRRNYLVSEPNYHTTKYFTEYLRTIEMEKKQILMNKPVYVGLSILELSKILMCEFWYDYIKPKYDEKAKLCYKDTASFIVCIKTDIYKGIAEDIETRCDTSNYEFNRPLPKGKNKKLIGLMKD